MRSVQTSGSTHAHRARISPSCGALSGTADGVCSCSSVFHASTFLPPFAPRALPRFCATMEALSPFGHGSSDPLPVMNAVPFPNRDP